jgi:membrane protein
LLTYYGFLSLFPLLLATTSILQIILHSHPAAKDAVIKHATQYLPVLGDQLESSVRTIHGAGFALLVGILITIWGAKGVADVFQYSLNHIWRVPRVKRPGFPRNILKSFSIILIGGAGLTAASFLSGMATSLGKSWMERTISSLISVVILYLVLAILIKIGIAGAAKISRAALRRSALTAAIGIQILQILGGYLVNNELGKLKHLYGAFAATLGLLFWIYLQARVLIYGVEYGTVFDKKLWPLSLTNDHLTDADHRAQHQHTIPDNYALPEK